MIVVYNTHGEAVDQFEFNTDTSHVNFVQWAKYHAYVGPLYTFRLFVDVRDILNAH